MPTDEFGISTGTDDAMISAANVFYPPTTIDGTFTAEQTDLALRRLDGATYRVRVAVMRFDTATLPDDAIISAARLLLFPTQRNFVDELEFVAEWYAFDGSISSSDYTGVPNNDAHEGTLLSTITLSVDNEFVLQNLGNINKSGFTGFRLHISEPEPTGHNQLSWSALEHPTNPGPRLAVDYTVPAYASWVTTL